MAIKEIVEQVAQQIDTRYSNTAVHKVIIITALATLGISTTITKFRDIFFDPIDTLSFTERIKVKFFKFFRRTSYFKKKFQPQIDQGKADVEKSSTFALYKKDGLAKGKYDDQLVLKYQKDLNRKPVTPQEILNEIQALNENYDYVNIAEAKFTGSIYSGEESLVKLNAEIFKIYCWANPLHTDMFRSVRKMEAEIIRQVVRMYRGGDDICGSLSSGGTESIFLACTAYRNQYRDRYGEGVSVPVPELIVPRTAHPAFNKACHYLGVKVILVEANPVTHRMEAKSYKKHINRRTMAMVCSSPQYPFGVFDEVKSIAKLGLDKKIPVHMDSCLGSFLTPLVHEAGFTDLPLLNWEVKGITSISCDTHKYGYTPKGTSVIMFKSEKLRCYSFYSLTTWPGGIYATATPAGSRPGVNVAMTWATMRSIGYDGYVQRCKEILTLTRRLEAITREIPGLSVIKSELQTVTFYSDKFNIFKFLAGMAEKGWHLQALQFPSAVHLGVTYSHVLRGQAFIDEYERDMKSVGKLLQEIDDGSDLGKDACALYGSSQEVPDRSIVEDLSKQYWTCYYGTKDD